MNAVFKTIVFAILFISTVSRVPRSLGAVQWPIAEGGNDHWYDVVRPATALLWDQAKTEAESRGGTLAVLNTQAEHTFVYEHLVQDARHWTEGRSASAGPIFGLRQANITNEPAGGWEWVTGEPVTYSNWAYGEPNNSGGVENFARFYNPVWNTPAPLWNDYSGTSTTYLIEYAAPAPLSIAQARVLPTGTLVTVEAPISFLLDQVQNPYLADFTLQDDTGGIAVFTPVEEIASLLPTLKVGDKLRATGIVERFNGYVEINARQSQFSVTKIGTAAIPELQSVVPPDFANQSTTAENLELERVQLKNVHFTPTAGQKFAEFTSYVVTGPGGTVTIRCGGNLPQLGQLIPSVPVTLVGEFTQLDTTNPAPGTPGTGYQLALETILYAADFNQDGNVDAMDYQIWRQYFGSTSDLAADGNGNGVVDAGDYVIWRASVTPDGAAIGVSIIPEPNPVFLILCALMSGIPGYRDSRFQRAVKIENWGRFGGNIACEKPR